jgi:hypothetical protein
MRSPPTSIAVASGPPLDGVTPHATPAPIASEAASHLSMFDDSAGDSGSVVRANSAASGDSGRFAWLNIVVLRSGSIDDFSSLAKIRSGRNGGVREGPLGSGDAPDRETAR